MPLRHLPPDFFPHRPLANLTDPELANLQGNILKSHGRDHSTHLFIKFGASPDDTRAWLKAMLNEAAPITITSHTRQLKQTEAHRADDASAGELFVNLLLSRSAYNHFGTEPPPDSAFVNGMAASGAKLADPPSSEWDPGYAEQIDAMLLLAHDDRKTLAMFDSLARAAISAAQCAVVAVEYGDGLRNAQGNHVEHFGYVDGRSQPLFLKDDVEKERDQTDGISVWDPAENAFDLLLVEDPTAADSNCFGSYFVFRKLEQNVRGFKDAETRLAGLLGLQGEDAERAGAMLVGRFEDGTPVVAHRQPSETADVANNFNYQSDPAGLRCPVHAHIRKMNPRGDLAARLEADEEQVERVHRITRRGITYGLRAPGMEDRPERDVGLLFMCFQKNIAGQFEFMQAAWGNNAGFPENGAGADPVIGQGPGISNSQSWPNGWGGSDLPFQCNFRPFVTLKGGCYLFAPSLKGLAVLAS